MHLSVSNEGASIHVDVIAIGESARLAINYLYNKKQTNTHLYQLKIDSKSVKDLSTFDDFPLELLSTEDMELDLNLSKRKDEFESSNNPVILVVDQQLATLKLALRICLLLKEHRSNIIVVLLNNDTEKIFSEPIKEIKRLFMLSDVFFKLDSNSTEVQIDSFNRLSSMLDLMFYNYQEHGIGSYDYADILTMLSSNINDEEIPNESKVIHLQVIEAESIYRAFKQAVGDALVQNSNVLVKLEFDFNNGYLDEFDSALSTLRSQFTGHCFFAPVHSNTMNKDDIDVTVFATKTECVAPIKVAMPDFLKN